jgi:hypothetical protein
MVIGGLLVTRPTPVIAALSPVLVPCEGLIAKSDGRDKLGRLVQYFLRFWLGYLRQLEPSAALTDQIKLLSKIMATLGDSRRTNRWLKGISPMLALREGSAVRGERLWARWALAVGSKVTQFTFLSLDHTRWMQQHALVKGEQARTGVWAMRMLALTHVLSGTLSGLRALEAARAAPGKEPEKAPPQGVDPGSLRKHMREVLKQLLCFLQAAHLGKLVETHDCFIGLCGVVTSLMDLQTLWPGAPRLK